MMRADSQASRDERVRADAEQQEREWASLMGQAQNGNAVAYERLLATVAPFIRALVRRSVRNPDQVEDVLQDTLLSVHRVRHTYDPRRPFTPWLAAIASRRTIDAMRSRGRITSHETVDEVALETFVDPAANNSLDAGDSAQELEQLLAQLKPGQRQALELVKLKEMSLAEASAASGQSVGALKVSVHRAVKALRARLAGRDT